MGSADNFHFLIKRGVDEGTVDIGYNFWILNSPGSPVFSGADNGMPALVIIALVAYNFWAGGVVWGVVSLISGVLFFIIFVRAWIIRRMSRRACALAMANADNWEYLWDMGALSVRLRNDPDEACYSPNGDWKDFARDHIIRKGSSPIREDPPPAA